MAKTNHYLFLLSALAALLICAGDAGAQSTSPFGGPDPAGLDMQILPKNLQKAGATTRVKVRDHVALVWREADSANPSMFLASAYSPITGTWNQPYLLQPTHAVFGTARGSAAVVGNSKNAHVFSATTGGWSVMDFNQIDGWAMGGKTVIIWEDGAKATGYSADMDSMNSQTLLGTGYQGAIATQGGALTGLIFNSDDAYGYSALTNSWGHQSLTGTPQGHSAGKSVLLVWDNNNNGYGYSTAFSGWTSTNISGPPITGVAGDRLCVIYNTRGASAFDGFTGIWYPSPSFLQYYAPVIKTGDNVALLIANDGAWAFDHKLAAWFDTGIVPGNQYLYQSRVKGNCILMWNSTEAWGYHKENNAAGQMIALDGTPAHGFCAAGCVVFNDNNAYGLGKNAASTWVSQSLNPAENHHGRMRGKMCVVWSDSEAFVFNTDTDSWTEIVVTDPPILGGTAAREHAVVWTAGKGYAYDLATGSTTEQTFAGTAQNGGGGQNSSGVIDDTDTVYMFSGTTLLWSSQQLDQAYVKFDGGGDEDLIVTPTTAYAFSSHLGLWSSMPLNGNYIRAAAGISPALVVTNLAIWAHGAYSNTWSELIP